MRKVLFWMHLGSGVLISALVIFFSITGALLAYERQIVHAADEHTYKPNPVSQNASRLPIATLIGNVAALAPAPAEMVTIHPAPSSFIEIQTADRKVYFADPYSGTVQGPASPRLRAFFAEVTALHRWFGLSNASHATAVAVKGVVVLLLLLMILSGAVLWIPRRWTPQAVRGGVVPRFDVGGRARNYNWHKVTGFWIAIPLGIIVTTGTVMAYPWANALLFRLAGSPPPALRIANGPNAHRRGEGKPELPGHLDEALAEATSGVTGWQSASVRVTPGPLNVVVDRGDGGHPDKREQVSIDPKTLQVAHREPFSAMSRGQRWRAWVRFTHTGEAGGWWGETLAMLTASGAIVLSITGIALSLDRLRRWRG